MAKEILDTHASERKATEQAGMIKGTTGEGEEAWPHGMDVDIACSGRQEKDTFCSCVLKLESWVGTKRLKMSLVLRGAKPHPNPRSYEYSSDAERNT